MEKNNSNYSPDSRYSLEKDYILLNKKSLLQRKSKGSLKIFYSEIIELKLNKSDLSSLYSTIVIVYSKNGYTKHLVFLSSSDGFAVRWFYDELVVRHSMIKSNLNKSDFIKSNEKDFLEGKDDDSKGADKFDDFMNQMNAEISEKRKKQISKQMKFDRCSSEER